MTVVAVGSVVAVIVTGAVAMASTRHEPAAEVPLGPAVVASLTPDPDGSVDPNDPNDGPDDGPDDDDAVVVPAPDPASANDPDDLDDSDGTDDADGPEDSDDPDELEDEPDRPESRDDDDDGS